LSQFSIFSEFLFIIDFSLSGDNPALFTVIPEKKGDKIGREMMGSAHTYDMSAATLRKGQGIDVALDPSDLEAGSLDSASVAARYEQTVKEQSSLMAGEDLSDMVAEHAARQKRKNKQDSSKSNKKYQFKF
jgi:splicing factor 3B subunit 2